MFYGKFSDAENGRKFKEALELFSKVFNRFYAYDNLIAFDRNLTFLNDKKFLKALRHHASTEQELSIAWRLHTLIWAAQHALHVPGDFVECGVYKGFSFRVLTDYMDFSSIDKTLYLYDTFKGIPEAYNSENRSNEVYEAQPDLVDEVREAFAAYPNVKVVQGIVPEIFEEVCPERISFLHIDMNSSRAEVAALEVLFDKVSPGGVIVFDDYGWMGYEKQTEAEIAFMRDRGYHIMEIPTGQGIVFKR